MDKSEIKPEMRVQAGEGEDYDTGTVATIDEANGMATVSWDSGVVTPCPISDLERI